AVGKAHKKRRCLRSATVTVKSVFNIKVSALFTGKPPARVSHGTRKMPRISLVPPFLRLMKYNNFSRQRSCLFLS
ncbi:MAG: hypothetical protein ACI4GB_08050, partial [Acutalibacteraceae bacterium]